MRRHLRRSISRVALAPQWSRVRAYYSTEPAPPPFLAKLKGDLKAAMKARDAPRLAVLRGVIAATTNLSKTSAPVTTDAQLVALLRKTARASMDAAKEFRAAGREDLAIAEDSQVAVLEAYCAASGVARPGPDDMRRLMEELAAELRGADVAPAQLVGEAMRRLNAPGGLLDGKDVDKVEVVRLLKEVMAVGP